MRVLSHRILNGLCLLLVLGCLLPGSHALVHAQEEATEASKKKKKFPLTIDMISGINIARSNSPHNVVLELTWSGKGLLEGDLLLSIDDPPDHLASIRIPDLVLSTSPKKVRTLIPALQAKNSFNQLELKTSFLPKDSRKIEPLQEFFLRYAGPTARQFAMGLCAEWDLLQQPLPKDVVEALRFETYHPDWQNRRNPNSSVELGTSLVNLRPADFPADVATLCAFDVVVIAGRALDQMSRAQLSAMEQWVKAGGSLLLIPDEIIPTLPLAFVKRLLNEDENPGNVPIDSQGKVLAIDDQSLIRRGQTGLGRTVVAFGGMNAIPSGKQEVWREAAAYLWKVRDDQAQTFVKKGAWDQGKAQQVMNQLAGEDPSVARYQELYSQFSNDGQAEIHMAALPIQSGQQLLAKNMPAQIRPMPLTLMALILIGYVIAIGPGDYLFLGMLRRRRLTWVLFPVVTVLVTSLVVFLSHWFMSTDDTRRAVVVQDYGPDGEFGRKNRFELLFRSYYSDVETEMTAGLFTPLSHQEFGEQDSYQFRRSFEERTDSLSSPPSYFGRMPTKYVGVQRVAQWTPQLNRITTFDAPEEDYNWSQVTLEMVKDAQSREALMRDLRRELGGEIWLYLANKNSINLLSGAGEPFPSVSSSGYYYGNDWYYGEINFLEDICIRPQIGLFTVISKLSPTGGGNFEDMALIDPTNGKESLIVVLVDRGSEMHVYRKLVVEE